MKKYLRYFVYSFLFIACKKVDKNTITETLPSAPSNLVFELSANNQIKLIWDDNSSNELGFIVERKIDAGEFLVVANLGVNANSFSEEKLTVNTKYVYRIYSFNNQGKSQRSTNEVLVTSHSLPDVTTSIVIDTTGTSAYCIGNIKTGTGTSIIARGIVWGTNTEPTIELNTKTDEGKESGTFGSKLTSLSKNTKYYVRAYGISSVGISYGNILSFTTNDIDLESGLLVYLPFTDGAYDSSGNKNPACIIRASAAEDRFGKSKSAFYFNGDNQWVECNISKLPIIDQPRSISFWVKQTRNARGNDRSVALGYGSYSSRQFFAYGYTTYPNNVPTIGYSNQIVTTTGIAFFGDPTAINIQEFPDLFNSWHSVVISYDKVVLKLFINGRLSFIKPAQLNTSNTAFWIGTSELGYSFGSWFGGYLDDIRIYNRAISEKEISYLANH